MRAFERLAHHRRVADTFKGIIGTAAGQLDKMPDKIIAMPGGVDEMRHAEPLAPFLLAVIQVDADNHVGTDHAKTLDDIQPDAAKPEDNGVASRLGLRGVDHRANTGGDAAADIADLVERGVLVDLGQGDFRKHGEIRKGRGAHVMQDRHSGV